MVIAIALAGCDRPMDAKREIDVADVPVISDEANDQRLETGIYLVNRWTIEKEALFPLFDNERFVEYREDEYQELQDDETEPVKYVTLDRTEFIPLELANDPVRLQGDDGLAEVDLTFSDDMANELTRFSRAFLGRQVAMVIDGDVVTLHKVRSVITGTGLKISRCTDDGCELILAKLKSSTQPNEQ